MKSLIIVDSQYGNTEKLAEEMASVLKTFGEARVVSAKQAITSDLNSIDLLIVGSPTQGGRATPAVQEFLAKLGDHVKNKNFAAFDTRFEEGVQKFALRMLMKAIGYAAPKIASILSKKGGKQTVLPEGFIVSDKEGPIKDGERERSREWAKNLGEKLSN